MFSASYSVADELVFFCGKDVTARKQGEEEVRAAEERFRAVTSSTRDAIISSDGSGRIIYWNRGAEEIFGHSAAAMVGRPLTDLMPERYRDAHRAGVARFLATGEGRVMGSTVEVEGVRADGTEFPVELSLGCLEPERPDLLLRRRARPVGPRPRPPRPARGRGAVRGRVPGRRGRADARGA